MLESRRIVNRFLKNAPKEAAQVSKCDTTSISYRESNRSLLIHDEKEFEAVADDNDAASQFFDKDIPADRREIINNASYFKQLSLSFYGASKPSQKPAIRHVASNSITKTEPAQTGGDSSSPRSTNEYFYLWRKSPIMQGTTDHFHVNNKNFSQVDKRGEMSSTSYSKLGISQIALKGRDSIKREGRNTTVGLSKEIKNYKANILRMNSNSNRATPVYPNLASSINIDYSSTPKNGEMLSRNLNGILHVEGRPSLKLLANNKPRPPAKGYLTTEPSSAQLKTATTPTVVPKKLKMYTQENTNFSSLKQLVNTEGRPQIARKYSKEILPGRPSIMRDTSGYIPKRPTLITVAKVSKRHGYYE